MIAAEALASQLPSTSFRPPMQYRRLGRSGLTFRRSLNAFARNFPAVGSSGLARGFQVDEALGLLLPGSHELLDVTLVVDGLLQ